MIIILILLRIAILSRAQFADASHGGGPSPSHGLLTVTSSESPGQPGSVPPASGLLAWFKLTLT